jgi:hypothetical protein
MVDQSVVLVAMAQRIYPLPIRVVVALANCLQPDARVALAAVVLAVTLTEQQEQQIRAAVVVGLVAIIQMAAEAVAQAVPASSSFAI